MNTEINNNVTIEVNTLADAVKEATGTIELYREAVSTLQGGEDYTVLSDALKSSVMKTADAIKATGSAKKFYINFLRDHDLIGAVVAHESLSGSAKNKDMNPDTYVFRVCREALINSAVSDVRGESEIATARKNISQNTGNWQGELYKDEITKSFVGNKVKALETENTTAIKRQGVIEFELGGKITKQKEVSLERESTKLDSVIQINKAEIEEAKLLTYDDYKDSLLTPDKLLFNMQSGLFGILKTYRNANIVRDDCSVLYNDIRQLMAANNISIENAPTLRVTE